MSSQLTRRRFLTGLAAGAGLAATGISGWRTTRSPVDHPVVRTYGSRPDLRPSNMRILVSNHERAPGSLFVTPNNGTADSGLMIVNDDGRLVWFKPLHGVSGIDMKVQQHNAQPVLTWWEGVINGGHGAGEHVIADQTYTELQRVQAQNGYQADLHDFRLTDQGTALLIAYQTMPFDTSAVGGSRSGTVLDAVVQEIDLATGDLVFQWRGIDHVGLAESYTSLPTDPSMPLDFLHLNSVDVDSDGNLLISARNTWAVYKVDRNTGAVIWRLGGRHTDYAMGPTSPFAWQHDARRQTDGSITLFDDGADPPVESQSRGVVLDVDDRAKTASLIRQYVHPTPVLTGSQGNVQVLPSETALVGWGAQPRLTEFNTDGRVLFDAVFPDGSSSYRAFRFPWSATPTELPATAVSRSLGHLQVQASWNGSTNVNSWRVLTGKNATHLTHVTTERSQGFETTITIEPADGFLAVEALDHASKLLSTSATVPIPS